MEYPHQKNDASWTTAENTLPKETVKPNPTIDLLNCWVKNPDAGDSFYNFQSFTLEHQDPIIGTVLSFSPEVVQYVLDHSEEFQDLQFRFNVSAVEFVSALKIPHVLENLSEIAKHAQDHLCRFDDIGCALYLDPKIWKDTLISAELFNLIREHPEALKRAMQGSLEGECAWADLDRAWSKELLESARNELTQTERIVLLHSLIGELESLLARIDDTTYSLNTYDRARFSRPMSEFVLKHVTELMSYVASVLVERIPEKCSPGLAQQALINIHPSLILEPFLEALGYEGPVAAIDRFRNYESCPETETLLLYELQRRDAVVVRYIFPDGKESVFALKFRNVTLAVCISSTDSRFTPGISYLPVGQTFIWTNRVPRGQYVEVDFTKTDTQRIQHIWAYNRETQFTPEQWSEVQQYVAQYQQ